MFWTFKSCIEGFVHCRPVILINETHVYDKYDLKLLIAFGVNANCQIFPLAFAIAANESTKIWS